MKTWDFKAFFFPVLLFVSSFYDLERCRVPTIPNDHLLYDFQHPWETCLRRSTACSKHVQNFAARDLGKTHHLQKSLLTLNLPLPHWVNQKHF